MRNRRFALNVLLGGLSLFFAVGCDSEEERILGRSADVRISFAPGAGDPTEIASWPHDVVLFREGSCAAYQSAANAAALLPFQLKFAEMYEAAAVAAPVWENLTVDPAWAVGVTTPEACIEVADMEADVPELLCGYMAPHMITGNSGLPITLSRAVARLSVRIENVPDEVTALSVTVGELYDRVSLRGVYGQRVSGQWRQKTIELVREEGAFVTSEGVILFPNDTTAANLNLTYRVTTATGEQTYPGAPQGRLLPNREVLLQVDGRELGYVHASAEIRYLPWGETHDVDDNIEIDPTVVRNNRLYRVEIQRAASAGKWAPISVHNALVSDLDKRNANWTDYTGAQRDTMAFAMFTDEFSSPVKVRVTKKTGTFASVAVRPLSYNIAPTVIDDRTVEFELQNPKQKVSVEFDGNRQENLFVFPDLPDTDVPDENAPNVIYFGPGEHDAGRISLESNQTLYLAEGAIVYGDVRASAVSNIAIRGRGILCSSKQPHGQNTRSQQINIENCTNVTFSGVLLRDSPHWSVRMVRCSRVTIDNLKQISWMLNSDGVDICNSSDVEIRNCFFRNYDDNITCKNFGWYWRNTERITVADNVFWADAAHCMLVGPEGGADGGSTYRTISDVTFSRNVVLENRETLSPYTGALGVMAANTGTFERITFEDILIEDIRGGRPISVDFVDYNGYGDKVNDVLLKNIVYTGTRANNPSIIRGRNATQCIDGVTLDNVVFNGTHILDGNSSYLKVYSYVYNVTFR